MDWYYLDESPIPNKTQLVTRRLRLGSDNSENVKSILDEFFYLDGEAWKHERIEHEISKYQSIAETARVNGSKGGRPKKPRKTKPVNLANPELTQTKANQEPRTKNQELSIKVNNTRVKTLAETPPPVVCPYDQIQNLYHEKLPMLPRIVRMTENRKRTLKARWKNGCSNLQFWEDYFNDVSNSRFLTGQEPAGFGRSKPFIADIDFLIRETSIVKMQEGKYHG